MFGRQQVKDISPARFNAQRYAEQETRERTADNSRLLYAQNKYNIFWERIPFCLDFFLFKGVAELLKHKQ